LEYGNSDHARVSSTSCSDCHNPHEGVSYKKLLLHERSAICLKCHERGGHEWLPERELHFGSLECTACHAPQAKKALLLYFSPATKQPLSYYRIKGVAGNGGDMARMLDVNGNNSIELSEIKRFIALLEKAGITSPRLTADGLVSEPHHGFTGKLTQARDCTLCHSTKTSFYSSVMLKLPLKDGWHIFKADQEIVAKTPLIPARENYFTTVHAKKGVECIECHAYQKIIREAGDFKVKDMKELVCGTRCHKNIMDEYKASVHYKVHKHFCLDCHEPHPNTSYAQLNAEQRRSICTKCHTDTERQHQWQTHQTLHCRFVECTMCHSPRAQKGLVLYLRGLDVHGREKRFDNKDLVELGGFQGQDIVKAIDRDNNKVLDEREMTFFLRSLNDTKKLKKNGFERVDVGVNLLALRPFHNFTEKMKKAKDCSLCHSSEAEGLASVVLHLPGPGGKTIEAPVTKEALLVFLPPPGVSNFYLLGGKKLSRADLKLLWREPSFKTATKLGYKLVESLGFLFLLGAVAFVGLHGSLRAMTRRIRRQRKAGRT
jgi:predicted CXXCH cytochrome family protein